MRNKKSMNLTDVREKQIDLFYLFCITRRVVLCSKLAFLLRVEVCLRSVFLCQGLIMICSYEKKSNKAPMHSCIFLVNFMASGQVVWVLCTI